MRRPRWLLVGLVTLGVLSGRAALAQRRVVPHTLTAPAGAATPERAAERHLEQIGPSLGLSASAVATARMRGVHDTGRGGIVVTFEQEVDGIPVFRERLTMLLGRDLSLIGTGGTLHPAPPAKSGLARFTLTEAEALEAALDARFGAVPISRSFVEVRSKHARYRRFDIAPRQGITFARPARLARVYFPEGGALLPAYYVEVFASDGAPGSNATAFVIGASGGQVLHREELVAHASHAYRVFADPDGRPADGPVADFTPHPTGTPDTSAPVFIAPVLVSIDGFNGPGDPWLGSAAVETTENNVDAYTDDDVPDGFSAGDLRATTTAASTFDRAYDPTLDPLSSDDQRMAAVTQLFYTTNWLHDYYYDSGFDELSGNAQADNYGRGGLGNDPLDAEAQNGALAGDLDNANMMTPADGESPRMQMYLWSAPDQRTLFVDPPAADLPNNKAAFGPAAFDVTGDLVLADDAVAPATDACQPIANDVTGKVVLIDRGSCSFESKAAAAGAAGAIGVIIADNVTGQSPPFLAAQGVVSVGIPALSTTFEDGAALQSSLLGGPVTAHLARASGTRVDGTIDNLIVAHEWGHYLHHRLVPCSLLQCASQSEGWGDFIVLMLALREGDAWIRSSERRKTGGRSASARMPPPSSSSRLAARPVLLEQAREHTLERRRHAHDEPHRSDVSTAEGLTKDDYRALFASVFTSGFENRSLLPALVYRANRCDPIDQQVILAVPEATMQQAASAVPFYSAALHFNVVTGELASQPVPSASDIDALEEPLYVTSVQMQGYRSVIELWPAYPHDQYLGAYADSDAPILMMQSPIDGQTAFGTASEFATHYTKPNQTYVVVHRATHAVITGAPTLSGESCGLTLLGQFVSDPTAAIDTTCTANVLPFDFEQPGVTFGPGTLSIWENGSTLVPIPGQVNAIDRLRQHASIGGGK